MLKIWPSLGNLGKSELGSLFSANIDCFTFHVIFYIIDPCDQMSCNGTNAVCQVVYGTGKPFCACANGFRGDPKVKCGKKNIL